MKVRFLFVALAIVGLCVLGGCLGLAEVDPAKFPAPKPDHITFWGHACVYIDVEGTGIVTDPVFKKSLFVRRRFIGVPPDDVLERTRVVLISHTHDDHLSGQTLARFPKDVVILCPEPSAKRLAGQGITAKAMKPNEEFRLGDIRFIAVMAHHPGTRLGLRASADGRALGWVIETPAATIFYSGDTNYCSTPYDVGWTYAPDIAILNVNGHLKAPDAARAAWATRAPVVIPTHWGAYGYWIVGGNRDPRDEDELQRFLGDRLHVLRLGESFPIGKRSARP